MLVFELHDDLVRALELPAEDGLRERVLDQPLDAEEIACKAMRIAADICVYTNTNLVLETLPSSR